MTDISDEELIRFHINEKKNILRECIRSKKGDYATRFIANPMQNITTLYQLTQANTVIINWFECFAQLQGLSCELETLAERLEVQGVSKESGNALYSALLPSSFNYVSPYSNMDGSKVVIRHGICIGSINLDTINDIFGQLAKYYGYDFIRQHVNNLNIVLSTVKI